MLAIACALFLGGVLSDLPQATLGCMVMVALDATALARVSLTVLHQFAELEHELLDRGVSLWVVALPPATLRMARQTARWRELADASHLFPTALAAVSAFRAHRPASRSTRG